MTDAKATWFQDVSKHGACITPYGRGREWADEAGPYGKLLCGEAIEAWGWDFESEEEDAFLRGVSARQSELAEEFSDADDTHYLADSW